MTIRSGALLIALLFCLGCASNPAVPGPNAQTGPTTPRSDDSIRQGQWLNWGVYNLEIARDGSYFHVVPYRDAMDEYTWGYHLNAVKLLEVHPCTNCLKLSNVHLLPNGDVSVDVSLTHPWPFYTKYCTGFDVRGIIMFPASQYWPDNELRELAGLGPYTGGAHDGWIHRYSSQDKGDAELINPDGYTNIWAPDDNWAGFQLEEGLPIFEYYPGKFATGEDLGTINPFKRFYSNENRHMFEVGMTVTRTYVIRPPADGPIEASYAVYAHWAPPLTTPVTDPAVDFPPEANSPLPYEFWITQDAMFDPDAPAIVNGLHIHYHIKTWAIGYDYWHVSAYDLLYVCGGGSGLSPYPNGEPDDYKGPGISTGGYETIDENVPGTFPGAWPYIFFLSIDHPDDPQGWFPIATDFYILDIEIDEVDGEW